MLTPNLVRARPRGDALTLSPLKGSQRRRAVELAQELLDATDTSIGASRESWEQAVRAVECASRERLLRDGLMKLIEDGIEFESLPDVDPAVLRRELFEAASARRMALLPGERFHRDAVIRGISEKRNLASAEIERNLFGDLRSAQTILGRSALNADALVEIYDAAQVQGVLLRAVGVRVEVRCRQQAQYRRLFAKLKFRRLLYRLERLDSGFLVTIDGPYSMFDQVTKYGLQLALAWNAFLECDDVLLEADIRWGKARKPLRFNVEHHATPCPEAGEGNMGASLSRDAEEICRAVNEGKSSWRARPADTLLDVPGEGVCVPDLTLTHGETAWEVHVELLGFWSRDAVWRRIEWSRAGLGAPVLFVLSQRLRVSEELLGDDDESALYAFKGKPSVARIIRKLDDMHSRVR